MMPQQPIIDMMRRTISNLAFIESHATDAGPYEVTQLINSFLGALAHPWEEYKQQLNTISIDEAVKDGWPALKKELSTDCEPTSLGDLLRLVRNGFAHGNIEFISRRGAEITHLKFWNNNKPGKRTWGTVASVDDLRAFLDKFVALAESLKESDLGNRVS